MTADAVPSSPLDREAVLALVTEQLAEILEKSPADIAEDDSFEDLGADSLALIELVEALEERLSSSVAGFHIDDEDLEGLTSVRDAVDYVSTKLQAA
ncbi:MAG TPA: acyl carrier protein [Acidimicrobiales bacterium]|nr:acyl carrier protein [Acidimicrobiales bacterium]